MGKKLRNVKAKGSVVTHKHMSELGATPATKNQSEKIYGELITKLDVDLQDIYALSVKPTSANKKFLYANSDIPQIAVSTQAMAITGTGIEVQTDREDVKKELNRLYRNFSVVNTGVKVNLGDLILSVMEDNTLWAESLWIRKIVTHPIHKLPSLSLRRLDVSTLQRYEDEVDGWVKWVQTVEVVTDSPASKYYDSIDKLRAIKDPKKRGKLEKQFKDKMKDYFYSDEYNPRHSIKDKDSGQMELKPPTGTKAIQIHIKDENAVVFDLYSRAPMDTMVLDLLALKRWLLYYMKKANETYAGPVPIVTVGNKEHAPNYTEDEYGDILDDAAIQAAQLRFGNAWAVPWDWTITFANPGSAIRDVSRDIQFINEEIYNDLGTPAALTYAKGRELATSRTIENTWLRRMDQQRGKILDTIKDFSLDYLKVLKFSDITEDTFDLNFPLLRSEEKGTVITEVINMKREGIVFDELEAREIIDANTIYTLPPPTPEEVAEMKQVQAVKDQSGGRGYNFQLEHIPENEEDNVHNIVKSVLESDKNE